MGERLQEHEKLTPKERVRTAGLKGGRRGCAQAAIDEKSDHAVNEDPILIRQGLRRGLNGESVVEPRAPGSVFCVSQDSEDVQILQRVILENILNRVVNGPASGVLGNRRAERMDRPADRFGHRQTMRLRVICADRSRWFQSGVAYLLATRSSMPDRSSSDREISTRSAASVSSNPWRIPSTSCS